jgi:hypothetical protein
MKVAVKPDLNSTQWPAVCSVGDYHSPAIILLHVSTLSEPNSSAYHSFAPTALKSRLVATNTVPQTNVQSTARPTGAARTDSSAWRPRTCSEDRGGSLPPQILTSCSPTNVGSSINRPPAYCPTHPAIAAAIAATPPDAHGARSKRGNIPRHHALITSDTLGPRWAMRRNTMRHEKHASIASHKGPIQSCERAQ